MNMDIHNVVKVELTEIREHDCSGKAFYTRRLYVTDEKGNQFELVCYADKSENIRIIREL